MFKTNKYTKYYFNIITNAKNQVRTKKDSHYENHHIIPKSMGGSNTKNNLVLLTAREHFICHMLLIRMVSTKDVYRMVNAIRRFKAKAKTSKEFENIRRSISIFSKGEMNPSFGKIWIHNKNTKDILYVKSEEFKKLDQDIYIKGLPHQRGGNKNTFWINNGMEESMINNSTILPIGWVVGRIHVPSNEQMKKISKARHTPEKDKEHSEKMTGDKHVNFGQPAYNRGRIWINDGKASKMIATTNIETFLSAGWIKGRLKN